MNNADLIVATLRANGIDRGFGIPSGNVLPLIALTCDLNRDQLGRRMQMWIDHHALFKPITKATLPLEPGSVSAIVRDAIALALSEPMGPVHLDLPEDVALAASNEPVAAPAQPKKLGAAADAALARAVELIAGATRPIAIIGSSAMRLTDPTLLRKAIERH